MAHIDTRGVWPTYIDGMKAITLTGAHENITLEEAESFISHTEVSDKKKVDKEVWTKVWNDSITYWTEWLTLFPGSTVVVEERIRNANAELAKL